MKWTPGGARRRTTMLASVVSVSAAVAVVTSSGDTPSQAQTTPIQHVVVIYQENHSFDNVFGRWCALRRTGLCDGAITGKTSSGRIVPLSRTPDIVPNEGHGGFDQTTAIHGGKMDQFDQVQYCGNLSC